MEKKYRLTVVVKTQSLKLRPKNEIKTIFLNSKSVKQFYDWIVGPEPRLWLDVAEEDSCEGVSFRRAGEMSLLAVVSVVSVLTLSLVRNVDSACSLNWNLIRRTREQAENSGSGTMPEAGGALDPDWIRGANLVWMTSFAEELAKIIEYQAALIFTKESVHTGLPSLAHSVQFTSVEDVDWLHFYLPVVFFFFYSFIFLPSLCNVQRRQWQVDYNVPKFRSNSHERPSTTWVFGGCCLILLRFRCLMDETPNSRYMEQTAWLMCLFGVFQSLMVELPQIRALVPFCCQHGSSVTRGAFCFVFTMICWFYRLGNTTIRARSLSPWLEIGSYKNGQQKKEREQNVDSRHPQHLLFFTLRFSSTSVAPGYILKYLISKEQWLLRPFFWSLTFVQVFPDLHKQINPEKSCPLAAVRDERPTDRV